MSGNNTVREKTGKNEKTGARIGKDKEAVNSNCRSRLVRLTRGGRGVTSYFWARTGLTKEESSSWGLKTRLAAKIQDFGPLYLYAAP